VHGRLFSQEDRGAFKASVLRQIHKVGACLYVTWGVIRIAEGTLVLAGLRISGGLAVLHLIGSGLGPERQVASTHPTVDALVAIHGWTSIGIGLMVIAIAITMNWRNSLAGFWLNLGLMATADLALLFFLVAPGITYVWEVALGPVLWVTGLVLLTVARHPTVLRLISADHADKPQRRVL
jgi:hypothetical protein